MSIILHIETSGPLCSVAIGIGGKLVSSYESSETNDHARQITLIISRALKQCNLDLGNVNAVAISSGPGSYTGLRVASSAAKGICYALNIPLIAVNTLLSLAYASTIKDYPTAFYAPMIDARRMEVYTAIFDSNYQTISAPEARIMDESSSQELIQGISETIIMSGSGLNKCVGLFDLDHVILKEEILAKAENLIRPAFQKFKNEQFEDLAYFKPFYLKGPNITTPKSILK